MGEEEEEEQPNIKKEAEERGEKKSHSCRSCQSFPECRSGRWRDNDDGGGGQRHQEGQREKEATLRPTLSCHTIRS